MWDCLCQIIEKTTQFKAPSLPPETRGSCLIDTRRIVINASGAEDQWSDIVEMARAIARGGETTLLVGHYPDLLQGRGPTMAEASQQGLGVSYCFFGIEQRLDLLAAGPGTGETLLKNAMEWWPACRGRYSFVLLSDDEPRSLPVSAFQ